ncbi:MAG: D-aminoacyl-tRNA deacylase [bacterium]
MLLVSQFTLYYTLKGQKPDFHGAMPGDEAKKLYDYFLSKLAAEYHNA